MKVPRDPALPRLGTLLDPDAMASVLERSLGRSAHLGAVRIARVSYKPGERATVHYEVQVDGRRENAVARTVAGRDLAAKAHRAALVHLAERVNGRSPSATPLTHDVEVDALLTWLPLDPRLPALVELPGARVLSYKPGRRAVLRRGSHVLKAYSSARQFAAASASLAVAPALGIPTPRCEAVLEPLRVTVHVPVEGMPPNGLEAAAEAGALVRTLQKAEVAGLPPTPRSAQLEAARRKAGLLGAVVPGLRTRVDALVRRLADTEPPVSRLVPAHGDFHPRQLLRTGKTLHVVDLDSLCLGSPGLDLAEFAAEGGPAVVEALLAGYGGRPAGFEWDLAVALLVRASHPFHRALPAWESRTEALVSAAEEAAP
jgi:Phosphotransferase enzyme family